MIDWIRAIAKRDIGGGITESSNEARMQPPGTASPLEETLLGLWVGEVKS